MWIKTKEYYFDFKTVTDIYVSFDEYRNRYYINTCRSDGSNDGFCYDKEYAQDILWEFIGYMINQNSLGRVIFDTDEEYRRFRKSYKENNETELDKAKKNYGDIFEENKND